MESSFFSRVAQTGLLKLDDRLCVKCGTTIEFLRAETIYWIEADDQYARFYSSTKCHVSRMTISYLEEQLDRSKFIRIHRRAIVNLQHVQEILFKDRKTTYAILDNGTKVRVSHFRKNPFLNALGDIRILESNYESEAKNSRSIRKKLSPSGSLRNLLD